MSLLVYNNLVNYMRGINSENCVRLVLNNSDVIEETTTMERRLQDDEVFGKKRIAEHYAEIDKNTKNFNLPVRVSNFKLFCVRDNPIKDLAIELVVKMYHLHCEHQENLAREAERKLGKPVFTMWKRIQEERKAIETAEQKRQEEEFEAEMERVLNSI